MAILETSLDPRTPSYLDNRGLMTAALGEVEAAFAQAVEGGGEKHVTRHHARGKLLPRERIELLVDRDSAFLELSTLAGYGTGQPLGAGVVTGLAVVAGRPCVLTASDPTVHGGSLNAYTLRKLARAAEIALANRLPLVSLVESDGPDPAGGGELLLAGGASLRDQALLRATGIPAICAVFGVVSGVTLPAIADQTILVRGQARVHLAGPHLVRAATGESVDDEALGGSTLHATRTGMAHQLAEDERDALRLVRLAVDRLCPEVSEARRRVIPPRHDTEDLLAVARGDDAFDPREILARVLDASQFDEVAPLYGESLRTGFGSVHGHRVGIIASAGPLLGVDEVAKAARFVQLATAARVPLVFLPNTSGFGLGVAQEGGGISVHAAALVQTIATCPVPMITIAVGGAHGSAGQVLGGRSMRPRFLFSWPNSKAAVLPPDQLEAVAAHRTAVDETGAGTAELPPTSALHQSGLLYDDGVIDPRDTRTVLGICLSVLPPIGATSTLGGA
ncbi:MAG: acyl-CoA carboxylase subunit beta [Hamadaea sp.]|uniref:acyl-CoA carboxylase subunit beta n=1 Tax=Hamadaea sp. TaxID=2024425 RepID=UPI00183E9E09|nr:carboxyl transferase domain-containing protein [Hamadaea sp.]NUR50451.1 acyl-CoA carboxylase subunit beta [Hamadaea sp.]NUR71300.1 acyl-CoA carboxylase subunit beta [Hamadaea sp.]NUT19478.1 acyl-CoA carboxylase subunit beta [Hamadaea sp.]